MLRNEKNEAFEFTFNWIYSTVTIYAVSVPADLSEDNIEVAYSTDYSMDSYYTELCAHFCPDGGLLGDWTIEQKAWLSSIIDAHWELETFRTYYINPDYKPYIYLDIFLLDKTHFVIIYCSQPIFNCNHRRVNINGCTIRNLC